MTLEEIRKLCEAGGSCEYKTLKELWDENGQRPFDAVYEDNSLWFHCCEVVNSIAIGYADGSMRSTIWRDAGLRNWRLKPKEKKRVAHYLAIITDGKGYWIDNALHHADATSTGIATSFTFVRLLTELPIYLEVEE